MTARDDVLARIADAQRAAPPADLPYAAVARGYRGASAPVDDVGQLVSRLVDRLLDYKALVRHCAPDEVATTITHALRERGVRAVVVPEGLDPTWLSEAAAGDGVVVAEDRAADPLTVDRLDAVDAVVTGCALAVAETGTLVLDGTAGQGRRAVSLVPDYHLCVVHADQVRADVPQMVADLDTTRPITMISGPSATSDIELDRVEGVHGPRTLEVVLVMATES